MINQRNARTGVGRRRP